MNDLALVIYIDGASRGNPGQAGAGVLITDGEGRKLAAAGRFLGEKTNNEAEYSALLLGLGEAKRLGGNTVQVFTDSELIARQVQGSYRVKDPKLKVLHERVMQEVRGFSSFHIESVPRESNQEADRLANQAIEEERSKTIKKGGVKGEGMAASHEDPLQGGPGRRKVRAP
jgi:ribonuclease HI